MTSLIVAQATIMFGWAMVDLAAISFLGLGVQAPSAELGRDDRRERRSASSRATRCRRWPRGACVVVVVIAFNVLGERLLERSAS